MYKKALEQMCENCSNHEMCLGTGCKPKKDLMELINFDEDYETMIVCAVRYGLGRRTYITRIITEYVKANIERLSDKTLELISRDIQSAKQDEMLGDECDQQAWLSLLKAIRIKFPKDFIQFIDCLDVEYNEKIDCYVIKDSNTEKQFYILPIIVDNPMLYSDLKKHKTIRIVEKPKMCEFTEEPVIHNNEIRLVNERLNEPNIKYKILEMLKNY